MDFFESAKVQLLEMMEGIGGVDLQQTPTFFFFTRLKAEMEELGLHDWVKPTLGSLTLEITALGMDYEPHEEWLRAMAKAYAVCIDKMITTFRVFGDEVVKNQLSRLSLKIE